MGDAEDPSLQAQEMATCNGEEASSSETGGMKVEAAQATKRRDKTYMQAVAA